MAQHTFILLVCTVMLLCSGCEGRGYDIYDETQYITIQTDTDRSIIHRRILINKHDTSRGMIINYWDNGNVLSKSFFYNGKLDGEIKIYNMEGQLLNIVTYSKGKKVSDSLLSTVDTAVKIFRNGKFEKFTSLDSLK